MSLSRALAARLRGIAARLPVDLLHRASADAEAAAGHLLAAHQGSDDTALIGSAKALRAASSTATTSAKRLREAASWIEAYCTNILGIGSATAAPIKAIDSTITPDTTRTRPSRSPDPTAKPGGYPARVYPDDEDETVRGITRENESAAILARHGYVVEQRPRVPGRKKPDFRIEGRIFDNYAPSSARARNIASEMAVKIEEEQTDRIVLNLRDTPVELVAIKTQLTDWPIPGLREVIMIDKNDTVIDFFP
ncbi:CdiA C-terminal domain-containing protein [Allokutzneria albata]|uniref:tRNA nuclease CdiA C-terminal domain-containing protein n=1 Tax=Allokutzneria albata TaxID=211114 RepID=A0A1G9RR93_ALLAB|nr:hypothetical protein [Allokutzneria albata]SDM25741.1 hypothetical protein SAMN04489726_0627 [Allokutzneria albata]